MFAQATASSIATDSASSTITGLIGPTIASCSPSRRMERSRFVSGYVAASRAAIVEISLLAAAIVAPARSLPIADSAIDPRWFRNEDGGNVSAVHTSAPPAGNRSASGGSTPTIVWRTAPTCSVRPTAEGSPPKCDFQNVYPSMTAGVAPKRYSSGRSARPISGRMPSTGITSAVASISVAEKAGASSCRRTVPGATSYRPIASRCVDVACQSCASR